MIKIVNESDELTEMEKMFLLQAKEFKSFTNGTIVLFHTDNNIVWACNNWGAAKDFLEKNHIVEVHKYHKFWNEGPHNGWISVAQEMPEFTRVLRRNQF